MYIYIYIHVHFKPLYVYLHLHTYHALTHTCTRTRPLTRTHFERKWEGGGRRGKPAVSSINIFAWLCIDISPFSDSFLMLCWWHTRQVFQNAILPLSPWDGAYEWAWGVWVCHGWVWGACVWRASVRLKCWGVFELAPKGYIYITHCSFKKIVVVVVVFL